MVAIKRLVMVLLALTLVGSFVPRSKRGTSVAILNATVIDGTGAEPRPNQTLIIQDTRITAIGDSSVIAVPRGAKVVDATGKFLIPGLWDMHVHALDEKQREHIMAMFLASGITGIRDMGCSPRDFERLRSLRLMIEEGKVPAPRIVAAGPILDGPDPMFPELSIAVDSETAGRDAVVRLCRAGTDFIKVYTTLPRDAYFAIADECRLCGSVLAGHVPDSVTAEEASGAGQKSIEHLTGILLSCSTMEQELRSRLLKARASDDPGQIYRALMSIQTEGLRTYDQAKARSLFQTFVKNGTWQVPTLVTTRALFVKEEARSDRKSGTRLEPKQPWTVGSALPMAPPDGKDRTSRDAPGLFRLVREMHQAGVQVMAGTDTPNPLALPGHSLHAELGLLVDAGFTPMQALQAATIKPAEYLGLGDRLGSIETGKIADLVLLNVDPLADIRNVGEVFAVVLRGTILIKSELDEQLAGDEKWLSKYLSSAAGWASRSRGN
jgi:imidazolonepropionase-like amidohydrolase